MTLLIGTTTAPGGGDLFVSGECFGSSYPAVASGDVETLTMPLTGGSGANLQFAIYSDSAGSPGTRLGVTNTFAGNAGTKVGTLTVPVAVVSGTTYWLALFTNGTINFNLVAGGTYKGHSGETAFQDPFGSVPSVNASNRFPMQGDGTLVAPPSDAPETLFVVHAGQFR